MLMFRSENATEDLGALAPGMGRPGLHFERDVCVSVESRRRLLQEGESWSTMARRRTDSRVAQLEVPANRKDTGGLSLSGITGPKFQEGATSRCGSITISYWDT